MQGAIAIRAGNPDEAVGWLEESLAQLHGMRYELLTTTFEIALAEGLVLDGRHAEAGRVVERTIAHCRQSGDAFALPELLRIKAGILKALGAPAQDVHALLEESLALSRLQGSRAWTLRTTMDQARTLLEQGRRPDAQALLAPWRDEAEGSDTLDRLDLGRLWQETLEVAALRD